MLSNYLDFNKHFYSVGSIWSLLWKYIFQQMKQFLVDKRLLNFQGDYLVNNEKSGACSIVIYT